MPKRAATDMPGRPMSVSPAEHLVRYDQALKGRNTWRFFTCPNPRHPTIQIEMLVTIGSAPSICIVENVQLGPTRETRDERYPLMARADETTWRIARVTDKRVAPQTAFVLANAPPGFGD